MVISQLKGGLGNQLFQYAAGISLARNTNSLFKLDLSWYKRTFSSTETLRNIDICDFSITAQVANNLEISALKYPYGIFSKLARGFQKKVLKRYYVDWHPEILTQAGNVYLDGYFQTEKYFKSDLNVIFSEFTLKERFLDRIQPFEVLIRQSSPSVSIHIRRGDYANDSKTSRLFLVCDASYYQRAIIDMSNRVPNCHFFIFSDDIEWVKQNLVFPPSATFISSEKGDPNTLSSSQELVLISRCNHHILSNSSFSWWGAYLNQSVSKIVLAPDKWNNQYINQPNILPDGWIPFPVNENE
jgi:hypothetical protein